MRVFFALSFVILTATQLAAADTKPSTSGGVESLGRELLDDLNPNIIHQPAGPVGETPQQAQSAPRDPANRAPHFDDLGEDIGQPSGPLSLVRVRQVMQHAESLLSPNGGTLQEAGAVQTQVVDQLDQLIAELSKQCQCQGGQCKPGDEPPKPSQRSQSKPGKSGSAVGRGQAGARDSTARLDRSTAQPIEKGDIDAMVKNLWGHLPDRSREQMLQSFSEEFLPQYELEIEQYYRRLSDEQNERSPVR